MKFAIASEHRDFFQNHQYIEFANLLNPEQVHRLHEDCKQALVNRLKLTSHFSLEKCPPSDLFSQGRDLWRSLPGIKKALFNPAFAELLGELCHQRLLRIGFDQYFPKKADGLPTVYRTGVYENFLKPTRSLLSFSSIQGLIGGGADLLVWGRRSRLFRCLCNNPRAWSVPFGRLPDPFFRDAGKLRISSCYLCYKKIGVYL